MTLIHSALGALSVGGTNESSEVTTVVPEYTSEEREAIERLYQSHGKLTPQQARQLGAQVAAYKILARGQVVPQMLYEDATVCGPQSSHIL